MTREEPFKKYCERVEREFDNVTGDLAPEDKEFLTHLAKDVSMLRGLFTALSQYPPEVKQFLETAPK